MTCIFTAVSNGVGDFVVGSGTSPGTVNATDGNTYRYYAASLDGTQWEGGSGAWHNGTSTLQRTAIAANTDGTFTPCNFLTKPLVSVFASSTQLLELAAVITPPPPPPPPGNLVGLTLSTSAASSIFGIASGWATDSTYTASMNLASAFTKNMTAWAAGTGNGSLDAGSIAASTWYHVHLIDGPSVPADVLISLSATAPTLPTGYSLLRRIGSLRTDLSSNWIPIFQAGDRVIFWTEFPDVGGVIPSNGTQTATLSVPPGVQVVATFHSSLFAGTSQIAVMIQSPDETTAAAFSLSGANASLICPTGATAGDFNIRTDTTQHVKWMTNAVWTGTPFFYIFTYGYLDRRGQDG